MRQMSLGIKFFAESQVSSIEKMDEENRFGELSTAEIQEIMDKVVPETTKKSHKVRDEII